jgi:hypothetical protein
MAKERRFIRTNKNLRESDLCVPVEKWARKNFGCFATSINKGTDYDRVDVVGLRQILGDSSAETEFICIEVKIGTQPFLNALGQASSYSIYGGYSYLAECQPDTPFSVVERVLAERLEVGLIRIPLPQSMCQWLRMVFKHLTASFDCSFRHAMLIRVRG